MKALKLALVGLAVLGLATVAEARLFRRGCCAPKCAARPAEICEPEPTCCRYVSTLVRERPQKVCHYVCPASCQQINAGEEMPASYIDNG